VTERPYNIRPARILEQSYPGAGGNVRHSLSQSRPEDFRGSNRPYRGQHRAEHTNHSGEHAAAWQRSSRVGRHHADPMDEHRTNNR
jgi:hypothetical protein